MAKRRRSVSMTIVLSSVAVALSIALLVGWTLVLLRNTEPPDVLYGTDKASNYQSQRLRLAKQFTRKDGEPDASVEQLNMPFTR